MYYVHYRYTYILSCHCCCLKDNFIGANDTVFDMKMNGSYPPYTEGIDDDIFIKDPRSGEVLLGEVWCTFFNTLTSYQ